MHVPLSRLCSAVLAVGLAGGCVRSEPWETETPVPLSPLRAVSGPIPGAVALPWRLEGGEPPGRQLLVVVPGADCRTPIGAEVTSTPGTVTVTVWGTARSACPDGGRHDAVVGVGLPEPLNGRSLIRGG
ncbi:hypothetical protein Aph02nite_43620 [Actinoplanes philippinensis]|uniref:Uncharacterized protein n=1 Tax=Actinoplanes philippinensis TaxID=35752 RepID=A0A1I2ICU2_9ACTN|nr:hypothetical protein [Actinoplanes philippinensis]GIE78412.1 hypothetical protein Aph02nite_43620 [Actinoplanes philippinensis]SFF39473.1 hypothetical protein SAMN05421541_109514 [Actinoplanes philippinensis]